MIITIEVENKALGSVLINTLNTTTGSEFVQNLLTQLAGIPNSVKISVNIKE